MTDFQHGTIRPSVPPLEGGRLTDTEPPAPGADAGPSREALQELCDQLVVENARLRERIEELQHTNGEELYEKNLALESMAIELSLAEERERDRIASELHDQVGQRLIFGKMKLDALASRLQID